MPVYDVCRIFAVCWPLAAILCVVLCVVPLMLCSLCLGGVRNGLEMYLETGIGLSMYICYEVCVLRSLKNTSTSNPPAQTPCTNTDINQHRH